MSKITLQLFLVSFFLAIANSVVAESFERVWGLYSAGFYEEAYKEIERSTGPLSQSSLWLLGEMHFLGRGTQADLSLGRKFIQQASSKSLPSKFTNRPTGLKKICSFSNTLCSDILRSKDLVVPSDRFLRKKLNQFGSGGCDRPSVFPLVFFYYLND